MDWSNIIDKPQIIAVEKDYLIVYKPPRMHSAPMAKSIDNTLLKWTIEKFPEIAVLPGRKAGEGGLLHRLDYETQGLVLIARSLHGMDVLLGQQREGKITKGYSAFAAESNAALPGFPLLKPELPPSVLSGNNEFSEPFWIRSAFRPFGPGRKTVRPVLFETKPGENLLKRYDTEILKFQPISQGVVSLSLRISKGFRHQIRCHLAWLLLPILNDSVYGGATHGNGILALRADSLIFSDPSTGQERSYSIPPINSEQLEVRSEKLTVRS